MEDAPPGASIPESAAGGPRRLEFSGRPASNAGSGSPAELPGEDDLDDDKEDEEPVTMKSIKKMFKKHWHLAD
eukprot:8404775-Pyramimonas_sp.AAC.1